MFFSLMLLHYGCGSKLNSEVLGLNTGLAGCSVIGVVHIQCPKLFKGLERVVLSIVLCTIKNP